MEDPILATARKDKTDPIPIISITENLLPNCAKLRVDKDDPI
jgi:hypothetical protein